MPWSEPRFSNGPADTIPTCAEGSRLCFRRTTGPAVFLNLCRRSLARTTLVAAPESWSENAGDKIGRYKLLQQIGEGGCGVVYLAEQEDPVRRRVALKVIKLGMDTKVRDRAV